MTLEELKEFLYGCTHCGTCKNVLDIFTPACPAGNLYRLESYYASGKMLIARGILDGFLDMEDEGIMDRIYACTGCRNCEQVCGVYHHAHIFDVVQALRGEVVTRGCLNPPYMMMVENLKKEDNVFGNPKAERGSWANGLDVKNVADGTAGTVYHTGCLLSFDEELRDVPLSAVELLKTAGEDVGIMGAEESCCGGRAYEIGYNGEFTKYAEHVIQTFNSLGVKQVVTSCSDGYAAFKMLYPSLGLDMNFEVRHLVQYLDEALKKGTLTFTRQVPMKVTWHDPCHLGRHLGDDGLYDQPRNVLNAVPGLELVEMERNRENAWCCGAGAGVSQSDTNLALTTAAERLKEAAAAGAGAIITACPWCERNFRDALAEYGGDMEIYDIAEIARRAL